MKPIDSFTLFIKCLGLLLVLYGLYPIYLCFIWLIPSVASPQAIPRLLYFGIPCLVVGLYFLRGAKQLVSFCYPAKEHEIKEP